MPYDFTPDPKDPRFRDPESITQQVARTNWEEDPMNPVRIRKFACAFGRRPSLDDVFRSPDVRDNPGMHRYRKSLKLSDGLGMGTDPSESGIIGGADPEAEWRYREELGRGRLRRWAIRRNNRDIQRRVLAARRRAREKEAAPIAVEAREHPKLTPFGTVGTEDAGRQTAKSRKG